MTNTIRTEWPAPDYARIVLARSERRNALGSAELAGLATAVRSVAKSGCRVLALLADGPAFSVGGDVFAFADKSAEDLQHLVRTDLGQVRDAISMLRAMDTIVVVGAQGYVAGGALGYLMAGDVVIGADDLRVDLAYSRIGASPDAGVSWFLPRRVGYVRAFDLMIFARAIDAQEALAAGILSRVVPLANLRAAVDRTADDLLDLPRASLFHMKRLLTQSFGASLEAQLESELQAFAEVASTDEFREKVAAFADRGKGKAGR